ncbi:MAG TPA: hypothetical protein PKA09_08575 [Geminicoccus sp.]|nr:hypothetical protein [Geminicoccus sp.]
MSKDKIGGARQRLGSLAGSALPAESWAMAGLVSAPLAVDAANQAYAMAQPMVTQAPDLATAAPSQAGQVPSATVDVVEPVVSEIAKSFLES